MMRPGMGIGGGGMIQVPPQQGMFFPGEER